MKMHDKFNSSERRSGMFEPFDNSQFVRVGQYCPKFAHRMKLVGCLLCLRIHPSCPSAVLLPVMSNQVEGNILSRSITRFYSHLQPTRQNRRIQPKATTQFATCHNFCSCPMSRILAFNVLPGPALKDSLSRVLKRYRCLQKHYAVHQVGQGHCDPVNLPFLAGFWGLIGRLN